MIKRIEFSNFKGFSEYAIDLSQLNLLVGGNNSGKTTIFHALQLIFWCIEQTADLTETHATFRKTQVSEIGTIPYFSHRDLFFKQQIQANRVPVRITLAIETDATERLSFSIYRAFGHNLMIDGANQSLTREQYDRLIAMKPVYIAGTIGITVQEEFLRTISQQRLISEGRQNQVLRNLVLRLKRSEDWKAFTSSVTPLFALQGMDVPFDEDKDEWLTATYAEDDCQFDLVSAGSGFLQTINLLCFLFLNESRTALLDEPDSHMHDDLQRLVFGALNALSAKRNLQLIIATHSPTMIDAAGLEAVRLVDRRQKQPLVAHSVDTLVPLLADQGLSLPPNKVLETLRVRRALFVEGMEADYNTFVAAVGEVCSPGFSARTRGLNVFETGGASKKWPFDAIAAFERLLGTKLQHVYLSDRDFLTDEEVSERESKAAKAGTPIVHLQRRNRESYVLEPKVLARVLEARWRRTSTAPLPVELAEQALLEWIIGRARNMEDETRSSMLVEHEPGLRGDHAHRSTGTTKLNEYFRSAYTDPIGRNEIPYKLLDAKAVLRALRAELNTKWKISFTDVEVFRAFEAAEVPGDLKTLVTDILNLFPISPPSKGVLAAPSAPTAVATHQSATPSPSKRPRTRSGGATPKRASKPGGPPARTSGTGSAKKSTKGATAKTIKKGKQVKDVGSSPSPAPTDSRSGAAPTAGERKAKRRRGAAEPVSTPVGTGTRTKAQKTPDGNLNEKEMAVMKVFAATTNGLRLDDVAKRAFSAIPFEKAYSWTRNSVRKPVLLGWLVQVGKGTYQCTAAGRSAVSGS